MKRLVIGILAHVDSGKTTLSEGILYTSGKIRTLGRVDHGNAYLDTNKIERDRGITIFSKQAVIDFEDVVFTLLDTPGHVDFSAETERTLQVLDYAILVISGTDGVQSHTETLWRLLRQHEIPTFIFVNKMDLDGADKEKVYLQLSEKLGDGCMDFCADAMSLAFAEEAAMRDELLMEEFLNSGNISEDGIICAIKNTKIYPVYFGSALKLEGVDAFVEGLRRYTKAHVAGSDFGAKVYKISEDERGNRLTHMKITSGRLRVKETIGDNPAEKINEIRIYSGEKYESVPEAEVGMVCAVTGPVHTRHGMGFGVEKNSDALTLEPIFYYAVKLPPEVDVHTAVANLKQLEEEETQLNIAWNEQFQEIRVQVMGQVQLEVLKSVIHDRFSMEVEFEKGSIIYKETIANTVEGVGHFEPLRHYAEVHLLMEPLERGSGIKFATRCGTDELDRNWQRLIMTHIEERTHLGVLTGSPITDIKITLVAGRAHLKHTEGGDFRQATYRAVRQGLMQAQSVILEPWYSFSLELPTECVGRAMTDISQMGGNVLPPDTKGDISYVSGSAPASKMSDYQMEVTAYTRGRGRLSCVLKGYEPCSNPDEIIEKIGYDAEGDTEHTPDSVFCSHGAGFTVKWNEVFDYMHLPALNLNEPEEEIEKARRRTSTVGFVNDEELLKIFEKTYGKVERKNHNAMRTPKAEEYKYKTPKPKPKMGNYMLVDGYNIIYEWEELKSATNIDLDFARTNLINRLCAYSAMRNIEVIVVFDAYKVKNNPGSVERVNNISVVYTKEAETADTYIENVTKKLSKNNNVRVATSDYMEQMIILGNGAFRITADEFRHEVEAAENEIREYLGKI